MKLIPNLPVIILAVSTLAACGGGGGGSPTAPSSGSGGSPSYSYTTKCAAGSGTISTVSSNTSQADSDAQCPANTAALTGTGIAGQAGSYCAFTKYLPQARIMDLDKSGYVAWWAGRVQCTLADGTVQNIAGLPQSAFTMTGNGFTATAVEDMVTGTSATDLAPTYTLQLYRNFASAAATTATNEALMVSGVDGSGQTVTAKGVMVYGINNVSAMDDLSIGATSTVAASRVIDSDGRGYTATLFQLPSYSTGASTAAACPTSISQPVKDFAVITTNSSNQVVDRRYCFYTGLTNANFYSDTQFGSLTTARARWMWQSGVDTGLQPNSFTASSAVLASNSNVGQRIPIYKTVIAIRFPKAPSPNFSSVEGFSAQGSMYWLPALGATTSAEFNPFAVTGSNWNL
ncbi:MAG: hypothetical protein QM533_05160 [Cytophagales bacterium]|nr:hypothetical protein [Cytophagales bacterium]